MVWKVGLGTVTGSGYPNRPSPLNVNITSALKGNVTDN